MDDQSQMTDEKQKEPTKRREDLIFEVVTLSDGTEVEALNQSDAAIYLGMSREGLIKRLKRLRQTGQPITTYQKAMGGKDIYLLRPTLDAMRRVIEVE